MREEPAAVRIFSDLLEWIRAAHVSARRCKADCLNSEGERP